MKHLGCWNISEQIQKLAKNKHLYLEILSEQEKNNVFQKFKEKYIRPGAHIGRLISEDLKYQESIASSNPESWRWIKDFITEDSIILFFNSFSDKIKKSRST